MNKNIIIAILAILTLGSLAYCLVLNAAATKAQVEARNLYAEAERQRSLADKNAKEATLQAEMARVEAENARRCEAECAKKK